ncbi:MAG TPA: GNAT family N-acetyltransferase [Lachnospiraceae bacterium]|nr:GNAT family N-acetyltransferase [Lachnospiraceae bacterium]
MSIFLKDIDTENWEECILLTTNREGKHFLGEEFVASNAYSIVQSQYEKGWTVKAIYAEDTMIGFTMYGYNYEESFYEICRLMIDYRFQGKGYGKAALGTIIEEMRNIPDCKEIFLSFVPENEIGRFLYESYHFKDTGRVLDDEVVYCLSFR